MQLWWYHSSLAINGMKVRETDHFHLFSRDRADSRCASQPFRLTRISVIHGVQDKFYSRRDSKLLEDPKEIFLDGVFAEIEFDGNLAIAQSLGDQGDDLFLAWSQNAIARGVDHAKRRDFGNEFQDVVKLLGVSPDLAVGDPQNTFAKRAQVSVINGENATDARTEAVDDQIAVD